MRLAATRMLMSGVVCEDKERKETNAHGSSSANALSLAPSSGLLLSARAAAVLTWSSSRSQRRPHTAVYYASGCVCFAG